MRLEKITSIAMSVLSGFGALAAAAVIMSFFAASADLPDSIISAMSGVALAAGCFVCSYTAASRRREGGIAIGMICGIAVFVLVLLIGVLTVRVFSAGGVILKLIIILTASAIGGISGVNSKKF
ncbi:MAG: TIGR04086 family membrane protein [Oscillospiraceae bacterium]|nr:TIGR04086 family membrane protein [Oscillospiraceae bacterium]